MSKVVTFTVKIDNERRNLMREFCQKSGIKIQNFLANAIEHEVKREEMKEELIVDIEAINKFENDKNKLMRDEKSVKKRLGL